MPVKEKTTLCASPFLDTAAFTCKEDAKTLSAQALAESIMDAYQRAKTMTLSYSQQWDKELTESLEKINPIRVTQS